VLGELLVVELSKCCWLLLLSFESPQSFESPPAALGRCFRLCVVAGAGPASPPLCRLRVPADVMLEALCLSWLLSVLVVLRLIQVTPLAAIRALEG
jgi:hypothetical protein